jgi:hypothetical protein
MGGDAGGGGAAVTFTTPDGTTYEYTGDTVRITQPGDSVTIEDANTLPPADPEEGVVNQRILREQGQQPPGPETPPEQTPPSNPADACSFSADTPVATPSGEHAIGSLQVGDEVTAYDPASGQTSTQTVQHVWINHDSDLVDVTLATDASGQSQGTIDPGSDKHQHAGVIAPDQRTPPSTDGAAVEGSAPSPTTETVHTTANHPWLTADRGWVAAGDLTVGEQVVRADNSAARVVGVRVVPGAADYYNLTVSRLHTYTVGESHAVVHNTDCFPNLTKDQINQGIAQAQRASNGTNAGAVAQLAANGNVVGRGFVAELGEGGVGAPFAPDQRLSPFAGPGLINCAEGYCLLHVGEPEGPIDLYSWHAEYPNCGTCLGSFENWADLYGQPIRVIHQIGNDPPDIIGTFYPSQWGEIP